MKISTEINGTVKFRATAAAIGSLGLRPFREGTAFTARGNLVHSLGSGWAWISRFDDDLLPLVADLEDIEKAEKSLALKVKFA
jgi:hypothetical protein